MLGAEQKQVEEVLSDSLSFNFCLVMFSGPSSRANTHEAELTVAEERELVLFSFSVLEGTAFNVLCFNELCGS